MKKQITTHGLTLLAATLSLATVTGCKQNPFPKSANGRITESQIERKPVAPAWSIEMLRVMNCTEGQECTMTIKGHVPAEDAVLSFENLPAGAVYDAKEGKLVYTPGFDVVDLKKDPKAVKEDFVVKVTIRSASEGVTASSDDFTISVTNALRPMDIVPKAAVTNLVENTPGEQIVDIKSDDLPSGPFTIMLAGAPVGMTWAPTATTGQYKIMFTPPRDFVKLKDPIDGTGKRLVNFKFKMVVSVPSGQQVEKELSWKVYDDRLAPTITAPAAVDMGPIVNFNVRVDDLNGEKLPVFKEVRPVAPFGRLSPPNLVMSNPGIPGSTFPYAIYSIVWDQITSDYIGQIVPLEFEFCSDPKFTLCSTATVKVTITGNNHKAPIVDRSALPISKIGSVLVGQTLTVPVKVTDAEDVKFPVRVKVVPASMASVVKYDAASSTLKITPTATGMQQFSIVATSVFEQSSFEGFVFEALPATWSSVIVLTGYGPSKEADATLKMTGTGSEMLSSAYQLTDQASRMRKLMVVTTDALSTKEGVANLAKAKDSVRTIVISSPVLSKSPELTSELAMLGLSLSTRMAESPTSFGLAVEAVSGLERPAVKPHLFGKLTAESASPQVFDIKAGTTACTPIMFLQGAKDYLVGASCDRSMGGKLIVLGFELGDSDIDAALLTKWFGTWVKAAP